MESRSNGQSASAGRIPPQDENAEKSLLGAILISDSTFPEVLEKVQDKDFYAEPHQQIFQAMTALYNNRRPIDLLTLTAELKARKHLKSIGGASYLSELTNFVPTASHASAYADIIAENSTRRRLIKAGTSIVERAYSGEEAIIDLIGSVEKDLFSVTDTNTKSDYVAMEDLLVETYDHIEELVKNKGALRGLKTGFRDLDNKTAGLQKGDLIIVGARPAMGKTTFAQNITYNVATSNGCGVLFFSLEMSRSQIVERMLADVSGVNGFKIRTGNLTDEDFDKIRDAMGDLGEAPIYIDDTSGMTVLELRNKARHAVHDHNIGLIVVDYLQLIQGSDRYAGNRVQEVTEISRNLKTLARELDVPVIALAQLSRSVTGRDDPRPVLSDLRESGSIEQDADIVMFLHRPDYYRQNDDDYEDTHITELIIAKHRNGPVGKIELYFNPDLLRFQSLDRTRPEES